MGQDWHTNRTGKSVPTVDHGGPRLDNGGQKHERLSPSWKYGNIDNDASPGPPKPSSNTSVTTERISARSEPTRCRSPRHAFARWCLNREPALPVPLLRGATHSERASVTHWYLGVGGLCVPPCGTFVVLLSCPVFVLLVRPLCCSGVGDLLWGLTSALV